MLQLLCRSSNRLRAVSACVAGLAVFLLAGCGSSSSPKNGSTKESSASNSGASTITIAGVPGNLTDPFFTAMQCGAQAAAKEAGVKLTWQAPQDYTVASASTLLSSIATNKPSGIMLEGTFTGTGLSNQVENLMHQGIPVTIVDAPISPKVYYQSFYSDNSGSGKTVASAVHGLIGSGDVGIITAAPGTSEQLRANGFVSALKAYPGIHVASLQYANRETAKAAQEAAAMISSNPNLKLIYATDGPQAEGAENAIAAANKQSAVKLIAFDATPEEIEAVRAGKITGLLAQTPYQMAYKSVQAMIKRVQAGVHGAVEPLPSSEQDVVMPFMFITKQNVNSPEAEKEFEYPKSC